MAKVFKTIEEQIELLKNRGLIIENDEEVRNFLLLNNYYRISGYTLNLRENNKFFARTSIGDVYKIYYFDQELRSLILYALLEIEINIKSIYSHLFASKFGPLGYLDKNNFCNDDIYQDVIDKVNKLVKVNTKNELYLQHFDNIKEDIPIWAYIESFTLSDLSKIYSISNNDLQKKIATIFKIKSNKRNIILKNHIYCLSFLRNICAHNGRLYNRTFNTKPSLNKREKELLIKHNEIVNNDFLFGFIILIIKLLPQNRRTVFITKIITAKNNYSSVDMNYYGFCDEWKNKLLTYISELQ